MNRAVVTFRGHDAPFVPLSNIKSIKRSKQHPRALEARQKISFAA
jgi:hypothetical protein